MKIKGGHRSGPTLVKTAAYTITEDDSGGIITNKGAAGAIVATLPPAKAGLRYRFYVGAAQELRIDPNGNETIELPSTGAQGAAGKYLTADAIGEFVELECVTDGAWACVGFAGTWAHEG